MFEFQYVLQGKLSNHMREPVHFYLLRKKGNIIEQHYRVGILFWHINNNNKAYIILFSFIHTLSNTSRTAYLSHNTRALLTLKAQQHPTHC